MIKILRSLFFLCIFICFFFWRNILLILLRYFKIHSGYWIKGNKKIYFKWSKSIFYLMLQIKLICIILMSSEIMSSKIMSSKIMPSKIMLWLDAIIMLWLEAIMIYDGYDLVIMLLWRRGIMEYRICPKCCWRKH